ncbi:unnamed protein product [Urochloa decumbens]|uniref:Zinc finger GRF-type domain-containing protein n=1 Tax=Urochloa decumbens TaxID=240449 RepID=A0ABC9G225_9POAL
MCPNCQDVRLIAFTCQWTKNRGKRFFKCPRNDELMGKKCGIIMVQSQYEQHLQKLKKMGYLGTPTLDALPDQLIEEVEQVKFGLHEVKEELSMIKLGMDEMKNKQTNCSCVGGPCVLVVCLVVLFTGWMVLK